MKDEVEFLPVHKYQRFLQIDCIILGVCGQACLNYPNSKCAVSQQYLKKNVSDEISFCMQINMKVSYILMLYFGGMVKHSHYVFQCVYNSSRKKLKMKLIFCMQINIKVSYKLVLLLWASNFLQDDTVIIDGHDQTFSKQSK